MGTFVNDVTQVEEANLSLNKSYSCRGRLAKWEKNLICNILRFNRPLFKPRCMPGFFLAVAIKCATSNSQNMSARSHTTSKPEAKKAVATNSAE